MWAQWGIIKLGKDLVAWLNEFVPWLHPTAISAMLFAYVLFRLIRFGLWLWQWRKSSTPVSQASVEVTKSSAPADSATQSKAKDETRALSTGGVVALGLVVALYIVTLFKAVRHQMDLAIYGLEQDRWAAGRSPPRRAVLVVLIFLLKAVLFFNDIFFLVFCRARSARYIDNFIRIAPP